MPRGRAVSRDPGYSLDSTRLGGIPKRSVPETVEVARLAGRVEFERPAPGRSGAGEGGRAAPLGRHGFRSCECRSAPRSTPAPTSHLPSETSGFAGWLMHPWKSLFQKPSQPRKNCHQSLLPTPVDPSLCCLQPACEPIWKKPSDSRGWLCSGNGPYYAFGKTLTSFLCKVLATEAIAIRSDRV